MVYASNIASINTDTTLDYGYDTYLIDASGGSITATLPSITADGIFYILRRIDTSTNTVTVTGTGGETIDGNSSITITPNSDTTLNSYTSSWYTVSGLNLVRQGMGTDVEISLHRTGGYITLTTATFATLAKFLYKGSNYYGSSLISWTIIYSLNTGTTSSAFEIRLVDVTPGAGSAVLSTISATATTNITTYLTSSSTTFVSVPTSTSIIEIQGRLTVVTNPVVRAHTVYVLFN